MSSLQKILKRRREEEETVSNIEPQTHAPLRHNHTNHTAPEMINQDSIALTANNPTSFQFTSQYFPSSFDIYDKCKFSFGVFLTPYPEDTVPVETRADKIPRCLSCRAYMNLYNRFTSNGNNFLCAFCGKENSLIQDYICSMVNGERVDKYQRGELHQATFSMHPPDMQACQNTAILMDLHQSARFSAYHSQAIFYASCVIKEVLSNPIFDDTLVFFYTYDEHVHEYDLTKGAPERKIIDNSIDQTVSTSIKRELSNCRDNLWAVLDTLEELAQANETHKSNLSHAFKYAFEGTQNYSPKMFITQTNEAFSAEDIAVYNDTKTKPDPTIRRSKLQSTNNLFYSKYVAAMLTKGVSISLFSFAKQHRNLKIFSDCFKLTNSEVFSYQKDCKEDSLKFYYDFYSLLSAHYVQDYKVDFIVSQGWSVSATYANMYRQQKILNCKLNNLSDQKYIALSFQMLQHLQNTSSSHFLFQTISSYSTGRSRRMAVTTLIKPLSNSLLNIFSGIDYSVLTALNFKVGLSMLRMDESQAIRNDVTKKTANFYMTVKSLFKDKIPSEATSIVQGTLALLKSYHSHVEAAIGTTLMDRIISERNLLQCCGPDEITTFFLPYLFGMSKLEPQDCTLVEEGFVYPPTLPLSFNSVSNGLFVMDCTTHIYLFIGKLYESEQLKEVLGVERLNGDSTLSEQVILKQESALSAKVLELLNQIRVRKSYGYIPLYVVKCGERTGMEMRFYLNFCNEKYQQFKNYFMSLNEFVDMLHTQVATNSLT